MRSIAAGADFPRESLARGAALSLVAAAAALCLSMLCVRPVRAQESVDTVAHVAKRIDAQLARVQNVSEGIGVDEARGAVEAIAADVTVLRDKTIMIFGEGKQRWDAASAQLDAAFARWASALSTDDEDTARSALKDVRTAWAAMKAAYPPEALDVLPELWTCPMHPEVMAGASDTCPTCGMGLDPIYETQPSLSREPIVRAEIVADEPLSVGKKANLRIRLSFIDSGKPVTFDDLEETHTRKLHLLIIDLSETDYHHEHPEPVEEGEYAFSFTPSRPGPYRVWADVKPTRTRVQQFAIADIAGSIARVEPAGIEPENRQAEVEGYKFVLNFDESVIRALDTVHGTLRVYGPDGQPYTRLQVVMGAFGHLVGFRGYSTVLHIHPVGRALEPPDALGGPELEFYFRSVDAGLIRFFTQVRIEDRELFPRFIVKVEPPPSPLGE